MHDLVLDATTAALHADRRHRCCPPGLEPADQLSGRGAIIRASTLKERRGPTVPPTVTLSTLDKAAIKAKNSHYVLGRSLCSAACHLRLQLTQRSPRRHPTRMPLVPRRRIARHE